MIGDLGYKFADMALVSIKCRMVERPISLRINIINNPPISTKNNTAIMSLFPVEVSSESLLVNCLLILVGDAWWEPLFNKVFVLS